MTSIFRRALGADFDRLHPQLRRRFDLSSADGVACVGTGVMDRVWHRPFTRPFLWLGARRHILVPGHGRDIPFTIDNYAYRDSFGRETMTFVRTFAFRSPQRWDATMVFAAGRDTVVDYLGTHQHVAVDLRLSVDDDGGLRLRSGEQRFHEGPFSFGIPRLLTGVAEVRESYDDDLGRFRIDVQVTNHRFGPLFGYRGTFTCSYPRASVPATIKPVREQART